MRHSEILLSSNLARVYCEHNAKFDLRASRSRFGIIRPGGCNGFQGQIFALAQA
jgi:hypothetical protein